MKECGCVYEGRLIVADLIGGKPALVRSGGPLPLEKFAEKSEDYWRGVFTVLPSRFSCSNCHWPVVEFSDQDRVAQSCRCQGVVHYYPQTSPPYASSEEWEAFRSLYEKEKDHPAPLDGFATDPFTGAPLALNDRGRAWLQQKLGVPSHVKLDASLDGSVLKVGAGASIMPDFESGVTSILSDPEDHPALGAVLSAMVSHHPESFPEIIVIIGNDPDYVWPPGTDQSRIAPLPYRCSHCGSRVKSAPIRHAGPIDRALVCLCMAAILQRGVSSPGSSIEWKELRLRGAGQSVKHHATVAGSQS